MCPTNLIVKQVMVCISRIMNSWGSLRDKDPYVVRAGLVWRKPRRGRGLVQDPDLGIAGRSRHVGISGQVLEWMVPDRHGTLDPLPFVHP